MTNTTRGGPRALALTPPPPLHTSETGSFARNTLAVRIPVILDETRRSLPPAPAAVNSALDDLASELRGGPLRGLTEDTLDRAFWDGACAAHVGRAWLDVPWFFAETFFYRRLLEATGYFGRGALGGHDPFTAQKNLEWAPDEGPRRCADVLAALPGDAPSRLRALLHASLWGNRADLSYNVAHHLGSFVGDPDADLLADDTAAVIAFLAARPRARIVFIADNAGTELLMDLALCEHMLTAGGVRRIDLHVKSQPMFVSDAIAADVDRALDVLRAGGPQSSAGALAARLSDLRDADRLVVWSHPFYTTSLFYPALPADLRADLGAADLVVLKGDANYRRLLSDARWPPATTFADVVAYFPAPLVALRTLKAEVIAGLAPGRARQLDAEDPAWMVNGRRAVIQARL